MEAQQTIIQYRGRAQESLRHAQVACDSRAIAIHLEAARAAEAAAEALRMRSLTEKVCGHADHLGAASEPWKE